MAINLRSPYYVQAQGGSEFFPPSTTLVVAYGEVKIYIWEGLYSAAPTTPNYTIKKDSIYPNDINFEISELIRDYLDVDFNGDYGSKCVWVRVNVGSYTSNGTLVFPDSTNNALAFDSYSYFEENGFNIDNNPLMMSNRKVFALADNLVRIPIVTEGSPTITFLKNGNTVSTYTYPSSIDTRQQIKYITPDGEDNYNQFHHYESYKERVLNSGGTFEGSRCLDKFFDNVEVGEVDKVIVSDAAGNIEIIEVVTIEECKYEPKKITFINKFGALQDMYFFKKAVEKMSVKKETYKSNTVNNGTYSRNNHVNRDFNVIGDESISLSSGFLSEEYNEVFKQLMLSEKVWITNITDQREQVLPINVSTSNITYKTSLNNKLVEYTIEFNNSYSTINNIR